MRSTNPVQSLQARLRDSRLDALLIFHLPNIFYLTGFTGSSAAVLIFPDRVLFLTDGRYIDQAQQQVRSARIKLSRDGLAASALEVLHRARASKIGFESSHLTYASFIELKKGIRGRGRLVPCVNWVEDGRAIKTADEVAKIRKSLRIVESAFKETLPLVRPGIRERELSAELEYRMKRGGAEKVPFEPIVASGWRSALPHGAASEKRICRNEFLLFDLGAILCGYSSDFTRTVFVGRPSAKARKIYQSVRESQECAIAGVRAGVPASDIDRLARCAIRRSGYGRCFVHSTGHGIGVEVHESPLLSARSKAYLKTGHVVTIEPGIYLPDYGGVRIEDIVWVHERGCDNLTEASKELITL